MTAITLMSYPFGGRPVYLALAPAHPRRGRAVLPRCWRSAVRSSSWPSPVISDFLDLVQTHRVTHTFLPPTLIYMVLAHEGLDGADLSSLQCFWYGAAPISPARLEEALRRIGPVMAQLLGPDRGADDDLGDGPARTTSAPTARSPPNGSRRPGRPTPAVVTGGDHG